MNDDTKQLIQEALSKALGEYIEAASGLDNAFMEKLAAGIAKNLDRHIQIKIDDEFRRRWREDMKETIRDERAIAKALAMARRAADRVVYWFDN